MYKISYDESMVNEATLNESILSMHVTTVNLRLSKSKRSSYIYIYIDGGNQETESRK